MDFLSRKTLNSFLVPGAFIVLGAVLLLDTKWIALSQSEVTFFYYATFVAGGCLPGASTRTASCSWSSFCSLGTLPSNCSPNGGPDLRLLRLIPTPYWSP